MPINPEQQFKQLLRDLFQLDHTDLDFGIYRILNLRSTDVEKFIDEKLPAKLQEVRTKLASRGLEDVQAQLETAQKKLRDDFQVSFDTEGDLAAKADQYGQLPLFREPYNKYLEAKEQLQAVQISAEFEKDIYNELYRFFQRYYDGGDFVTKPRAGDNAYMIPYNGEEVKLYWANHDQYYIKTGDNFKNYVFTNGIAAPKQDVTVEFRLKEAETAQNNNIEDKDRRFVPTEDFFQWDAETRTLNLWFSFTKPTPEQKEKWGDKQDVKSDNKGINQKIMLALPDLIKETNDPYLVELFEKTKPDSKNNPIPVFFYHLQRYTSINSFDYFIHKDLRKFLSSELDYFLKNEVLSINFLAADWSEQEVETAIKRNVIRSGAIRDIALQIIDFMAELEDYQKMLYEKKKFVVQSDWCFTLDLIPASVYEEISQYVFSDPKKRQLEEWKQLGFIESLNIDAAYMKEHDKLVLDTQFLTVALKDLLLSSIKDLEGIRNGLLINSDNFQGLNFIKSSYKGRVSNIYVDPPYNAKSSEIAYKNSFKHSSWYSMIENRVRLSYDLLSEKAFFQFAIDDYELKGSLPLLENIFGEANFVSTITVVHNPRGRNDDKFFATCHEYMLVYVKDSKVAQLGLFELSDADKRQYNKEDQISKYSLVPYTRTGNNSKRSERPNLYYPIYVNPETLELSLVAQQNWVEVLPLNPDGEEKTWRWGQSTFMSKCATEIEVTNTAGQYRLSKKRRLEGAGKKPRTIWVDPKYDASSHGIMLLRNILGADYFSYPKSINTVIDALYVTTDKNAIVLDYFAGSATTGHAVIELNRNDQGNRSYILIEMGEYFKTVTKPRVQKVAYSREWSGGKPKDGVGVTQCFQYLKLEQYEDTLNNISFDLPVQTPSQFLALSSGQTLAYNLRQGSNGSSSLLSVEKFKSPFDYEMDIVELNERKPTKVDLLTTFNFLLGIKVKRILTVSHLERTYRVVTGIKGKQQFVIVWRNYDDALDLAAERDWVKQQEWYSDDARTYSNADNAFGAASTEDEFKRLMFEGTDAN